VKVLIVDDSSLLRERMVAVLSEIDGLEIVGNAAHGEEALEKVTTLMPDLVLLDVRMPGMNGIEVLTHLSRKKREDPGHGRRKVIVFTNYPYPQYRDRCLDLGADYFFDKSSEFKELFETCRNLAAQYDSRAHGAGKGNGSR
jgi:DNA-binding NarL/FixJ family response regulator